MNSNEISFLASNEPLTLCVPSIHLGFISIDKSGEKCNPFESMVEIIAFLEAISIPAALLSAHATLFSPLAVFRQQFELIKISFR